MASNMNLRALAWWKVLLVSVVLPPVGIILWWLRPWPDGWVRRVVGFTGRLAMSAALAILTMVYLVRLNIVHMEMSGAGWQPILSLQDPERDLEALEQHRAAQRAAAPETSRNGAPRPAGTQNPEADTLPAAGTNAGEGATNNRTTAAASTSEPWADFRGAGRQGIYTERPILTEWPEDGLPHLWRQPVGGGYASFAVVNGKAFTIEQRRDREVVAAYDLMTGREIWTDGWSARFTEAMGGDGPRATLVWSDGRLYALGATGEFRCYDSETGKVLWGKNILSDTGAANILWGMANSPLVADDKVIVTPGGRDSSVVAYHRLTGKRMWGSLDDAAAYTSPMVVELAGQRQVLLVTTKRVIGIKIEDGALLWEFPWVTMYDINASQPILVDDRHVLVSAGYDHGSALLEITKGDGGFTVRPVWQNKNLKSRFNAPVLHRGHVYGFDESIFACIDLQTGERKWKGGRYGYGQTILAGEHLIVLAESGELVLLKATPESHQELARFPAIEGKTWNHPAIADGILLVRNEREMAAFRIGR
jgi:outer membrane protein assembly factor BamB